MQKTSMTEKEALIRLLENRIYDLLLDAVPIDDYYSAVRDTYCFDVSRKEIEKLRQENQIRKQ